MYWLILFHKLKFATFFLKHQIDTGNVIFQEKEPIHNDDNVGTVYERLMLKGAELVLKTVKAIELDDYPQLSQDESVELKHAPKIFKETCKINWNQSSNVVYNFIRGLSPYPAAWTEINNVSCKIFKATVVNEQIPTGEWKTDNKTFLHFGTENGSLAIEELQLQGKKRMDIASFLRGNKL